MTALYTLPPWLSLVVAGLLILGSSLTLLGAFGLVRLRTFYDRLHAPTLGTSWGAAAILLASLVSWSWVEGRLFAHEVVIGLGLMVTTPITLLLLGRAALHRDRKEGNDIGPLPERPPATEAPSEARAESSEAGESYPGP